MTDLLHDRCRRVLGNDGAEIFASALRCTTVRLKYPIPQGRLIAALELLETAAHHGVEAHDLPGRWQPDHVATLATGRQIRERFAALFGNSALVSRLAFAVEMSICGLRQVLASDAGRGVDDLQAVVELIEMLQAHGVPRAAWPRRWRMVEKITKPRVQKSKAPNGQEFASRIARAFGGKKPGASFARALERTPESFSRVWWGERDSHGRMAVVQTEIVAIVELLEALVGEGVPVDRWPARWRKVHARALSQ